MLEIVFPLFYGESIDQTEYKIIELQILQGNFKKKEAYQIVIIRGDHDTLLEAISIEEFERLATSDLDFYILAVVKGKLEFENFVLHSMDLLLGDGIEITRDNLLERLQKND